jgi:putative (di)nucleoside polyphosphate hydrolase
MSLCNAIRIFHNQRNRRIRAVLFYSDGFFSRYCSTHTTSIVLFLWPTCSRQPPQVSCLSMSNKQMRGASKKRRLTRRGQPYRPNACAIILDENGSILLCERAKQRGAWQFPQGGIEVGEDPAVAILRELEEELRTDAFTIIGRARGVYRYDFPRPVRGKERFRGQEQTYFLIRFTGDKPITPDGRTFSAARWVKRESVMEECDPPRRAIYRMVFDELRHHEAFQEGRVSK